MGKIFDEGEEMQTLGQKTTTSSSMSTKDLLRGPPSSNLPPPMQPVNIGPKAMIVEGGTWPYAGPAFEKFNVRLASYGGTAAAGGTNSTAGVACPGPGLYQTIKKNRKKICRLRPSQVAVQLYLRWAHSEM